MMLTNADIAILRALERCGRSNNDQIAAASAVEIEYVRARCPLLVRAGWIVCDKPRKFKCHGGRRKNFYSLADGVVIPASKTPPAPKPKRVQIRHRPLGPPLTDAPKIIHAHESPPMVAPCSLAGLMQQFGAKR